jgi:hypothetical protein
VRCLEIVKGATHNGKIVKRIKLDNIKAGRHVHKAAQISHFPDSATTQGHVFQLRLFSEFSYCFLSPCCARVYMFYAAGERRRAIYFAYSVIQPAAAQSEYLQNYMARRRAPSHYFSIRSRYSAAERAASSKWELISENVWVMNKIGPDDGLSTILKNLCHNFQQNGRNKL